MSGAQPDQSRGASFADQRPSASARRPAVDRPAAHSPSAGAQQATRRRRRPQSRPAPRRAFLKQVPHRPATTSARRSAVWRSIRWSCTRSARPRAWEKVVTQDQDRDDAAERRAAPGPRRLDRFAAELEARLDAADPQRASTRRRCIASTAPSTPMRFAICSTLDINVNTLLPADGSSEGFDNLAEALAVSPSLIQGYVSAAMKISRLAVGDRTMAPSQIDVSRRRPDWRRTGTSTGCRSARVAAWCIHHTFPLDAEYEFTLGGGGGGRPRRRSIVTLDGATDHRADNPRGFRLTVTRRPARDRRRASSIVSAAPAWTRSIRTSAANNGFTTPGGVPSTGHHRARSTRRARATRRAAARSSVCKPASAD